MIETGNGVTLVIVRRCVEPLQERHRGTDVPTGLENTMHFRNHPIRVLHMLKNGFRDNGIENGVLEGEAMPVAENIDTRRGVNFEVDGVGRALIKTRPKI